MVIRNIVYGKKDAWFNLQFLKREARAEKKKY